MIRALTIAAALAAFAAPAMARDITVSLVGKSSETIQADITKAAVTVCRDMYAMPADVFSRTACVKATIEATYATIARAEKLASASNTTLASR